MHSRHLLPVLALVGAVSSAAAQSEPVATRPTHTKPVIDTTGVVRDSTPVADSAATPARQPGPGCWRAQPLPRCEGFIVTDIGFEFPAYTTRRAVPTMPGTTTDFGTRLVWSFGFMNNVRGDAMGPVFSLAPELERAGVPWMLEWRYRRWQSATRAIDFGLGYKSNQVRVEGERELRGRGATAMVGWTPSRWIGVNARFELIAAGGNVHRALLVGVTSTRSSEFLTRALVVEIWRAMLAKIGIEWGNDEES